MTSTLPDATAPRTQDSGQFDALAQEAIALVRHWLTEASKIPRGCVRAAPRRRPEGPERP